MTWWNELVTADRLTIRRARLGDAAALARIQVDSWRETYGGIIAPDYLASLSYAQHERQWKRVLGGRGWAFIAVWENQIVGLASGGRRRGRNVFAGEIYILYVLRAYHGRGIGRALFDACSFELARCGMGTMIVWVLGANQNARTFYERLGGEAVGESTCTIGGQRLREVGYGWRS